MIRTLWRAMTRRKAPTKDLNYIDFSKYREKGAYHWNELKKNEEYRSRVSLVLPHVRRDRDCLDLGCGDGAYLGLVAPLSRASVGIDADPDAVILAKDILARHGVHNCSVIQSTLGELTTKLGRRAPFDLVYSMDVFEHLPCPEELLQVANAWCKPDGMILIGTPIFVRDELVSPYHVKEYTVEELKPLLEKHLTNWQEVIQPMKRKDGVVYTNGYYLAIGRPAARSGLRRCG